MKIDQDYNHLIIIKAKLKYSIIDVISVVLQLQVLSR